MAAITRSNKYKALQNIKMLGKNMSLIIYFLSPSFL